MISRFEDLWESAGDGAASPVGVVRPDWDTKELMKAWFRERRDSIECRLYLDEARRLLRKMLDGEGVTPRLRKRVEFLLRAVSESERGTGGEE
jgi:hypothetical protein